MGGGGRFKSNWYGRPNPEGWKIEKPEGRIYDEMAKLLKNCMAKFDQKAE